MQESTESNNLCILILTYNRSEAINYYLKKKLNYFRDSGFDVVIYDSSLNDLTKKVVERYINEGCDSLKYVHYKDPAGDIYGRTKSRDALIACANDYEYVWLCGDTTILLLEEYRDELYKLLDDKYDLIHIYDNEIGMDTCLNMDYREFFEKFYWSMTHWCSFILSKRLIRKMDKWMTKCLKMDDSLAVVNIAIFAALPKGNFRIAYLYHTLCEISPCRIESTSHEKKDILRGWAKYINLGINVLPKEYNDLKASVKRTTSDNVGLFTYQGVIDLRADGNITFKKLLNNARHLKQLTDVPLAWFYLWSILPKRIAREFSDDYWIKAAEKRLEKLNGRGIKLIVYGAGRHGEKIITKIEWVYNNIEVVAISDKNWSKVESAYRVISPSDICAQKYDYVGIAIVNRKVYREVKRTLAKSGVPIKQIVQI